MTFVFIRSWHTIRLSRDGRYVTLCGRLAHYAAHQTSDELPAGRSCESCLRIVARRADG